MKHFVASLLASALIAGASSAATAQTQTRPIDCTVDKSNPACMDRGTFATPSAPGASTATGAPVVTAPAPSMVTGSTAGSPFPYAAPHEVQTINGRLCRTVYDDRTQRRVPVECVVQ